MIESLTRLEEAVKRLEQKSSNLELAATRD